jgi:hypothetical protein
MRAVLAAAGRAGHLSKRSPAFWVTEFSWDSSPPDPQGVPSALLTRWVAEALYRMWSDGVSLVTWLQVRDQPIASDFFQSGLLYANWQPKPALRAFRFPLVALPDTGGVRVWGRTPRGEPRRVVVEQRLGGAWKRVATLTPDRYGVFQTKVAVPARGLMRARTFAPAASSSPSFGVALVADRFFNPFGQPTRLEPETGKK